MKKRFSALIAVALTLCLFSTLVCAAGPEAGTTDVPEQDTVSDSGDGAVPGETDDADVPADIDLTAKEDFAAPEETVEENDSGEEAPADTDDGAVPMDDTSALIPEEAPASEGSAEDDDVLIETPYESPGLLGAGEGFNPDGDPLSYEILSANDRTVAVTGGQQGLTTVSIPATVTYDGVEYEVTEIAKDAFANETAITDLTFAAGSRLKVIRENAFAYNAKDGSVPAAISNLTLPASLEMIEDGAFHCRPVKSFALEANSSLTAIPDGFLAADGADGKAGTDTECDSLWDYIVQWFVALSTPVSTPEALAKACDCLESINFGSGNSLERIGMGAFKNQSHLTAVDFGTSTVDLTIARGAFTGVGNGGSGIDTLTLPANLAVIESRAFDFARVKNLAFSGNCRLTALPDGFMEVSGEGCNGYPGKNNSGQFVNDPAQISANSLVTINFGANNHLAKVGRGAFGNQSHLTSIDFGTSAAQTLRLESGAFIGAGNNGYLVDMGIDETLNSGIETLTLPANLVMMGTQDNRLLNGVFDYARVKHLVLSDNCKLERIPQGFLGVDGYGNNGYPGMSRYSNKASFVADSAQLAVNCLESVDFGSNTSLAYISGGAFYNQSHLTSINFGTTTTALRIESGAFIGVANNAYLVENGIDEALTGGIETLTLPANLTTLAEGAFDYAYVKNLALSDNCRLQRIPGNFLGCWGIGNNGHPGQNGSGDFVEDQVQLTANSLETINFGKNNRVSTIASGAFRNQSHLKSIDFGTSVTGSLKIEGAAFDGAGNNTWLYKNHADEVLSDGFVLTLPSNLVTMYSSAFSDSGVTDIVFSDGIQINSLPEGTFQDLDRMQELTFGDDCPLTALDGGVFSKCDELTTVDLRQTGITTIADTLKQNPKLTCVYFPETLSSVTWKNTDMEGKCPFYECGSVNELHFAGADPSGITFTKNALKYLNSAGVVYVPDAATYQAVKNYVSKLTAAGLTFGPDNWKIKRETTAMALRVYGKNRYSTALATANWLKQLNGNKKFKAVVLASGLDANYPDALAGGYLAQVRNAPLLLIRDKAADNKKVTSWVKANLDKGGTIYVLGSKTALPDSWFKNMKSGYTVKRLGGSNRYATNVEILKAAGVKSGKKTFIATTGTDYSDALCASAMNYPLFLLNMKKNVITEEQKAYLKNLKGSTFYIVGPTSVVSSNLEKALKSSGMTVKRIAKSSDKIARSADIANYFYPKADSVALAISTGFADGLSGGPLAAKMKAPLLLVKSKSEAKAADYVNKKGVTDAVVFGSSSGAVPDASVKKVIPDLENIDTLYVQ